MEIRDFDTREEFLNNIKSAKFNTKKCIKLAHTVTKIEKAIKMIFKGDLNGINRIIVRKFKGRK